ncbi:hypothetical protein M4I32_14745 [Microbacterium sp. LRZ72]|uniref:hypothetical protein n=1 Tax=Microbacterium sp. LRZ72 TaxID=2942481 RepID=UPI0029B92D84|nr:hypothetical protein [Microbacterium sp. LRZ72]MDX2378048.1 hypothetical protein [Microbacterium sp. LRZ72]
MTAAEPSLSLTLTGRPDLPSEVLKALYRITGRASTELRRSILAGEPVFTAHLFGTDHVDVAPRLEKTVAYLGDLGIDFAVHESADGTSQPITLETMRSILETDAEAQAETEPGTEADDTR